MDICWMKDIPMMILHTLVSKRSEGSDGTANISNINQAFEDLIAFEDPLDEVIIYISDHEQGVLGNSSFVFIDD